MAFQPMSFGFVPPQFMFGAHNLAMKQGGQVGTKRCRRGKWNDIEEKYADELIDAFRRGFLPGVEDGCTLRAFLASKLQCDPMRISKKFSGTSIGKLMYSKREGPQQLIDSIQKHLADLDGKFRESLDALKKEELSSSEPWWQSVPPIQQPMMAVYVPYVPPPVMSTPQPPVMSKEAAQKRKQWLAERHHSQKRRRQEKPAESASDVQSSVSPMPNSSIVPVGDAVTVVPIEDSHVSARKLSKPTPRHRTGEQTPASSSKLPAVDEEEHPPRCVSFTDEQPHLADTPLVCSNAPNTWAAAGHHGSGSSSPTNQELLSDFCLDGFLEDLDEDAWSFDPLAS